MSLLSESISSCTSTSLFVPSELSKSKTRRCVSSDQFASRSRVLARGGFISTLIRECAVWVHQLLNLQLFVCLCTLEVEDQEMCVE